MDIEIWLTILKSAEQIKNTQELKYKKNKIESRRYHPISD